MVFSYAFCYNFCKKNKNKIVATHYKPTTMDYDTVYFGTEQNDMPMWRFSKGPIILQVETKIRNFK